MLCAKQHILSIFFQLFQWNFHTVFFALHYFSDYTWHDIIIIILMCVPLQLPSFSFWKLCLQTYVSLKWAKYKIMEFLIRQSELWVLCWYRRSIFKDSAAGWSTKKPWDLPRLKKGLKPFTKLWNSFRSFNTMELHTFKYKLLLKTKKYRLHVYTST